MVTGRLFGAWYSLFQFTVIPRTSMFGWGASSGAILSQSVALQCEIDLSKA